MKKRPKQIHKAYILNRLYINGIYAHMNDYLRLLDEINKGTPYTIDTSTTKINVIID